MPRSTRLALALALASAPAACADDAAGDGTEASSSGSGSGSAGSGGATSSANTTANTTTVGSADGSSSSSGADSGGSSSSSSSDGGSSSTGGGEGGGIFEQCFGDQFVNAPNLGPDYDQFAPTIGSHCLGTDHQDITDIERVVFLGDSITVGTPPTLPAEVYRTELADVLTGSFSLSSPDLLWQLYDIFNGTTVVQDSGSFASCSKWGARTDDLLPPGYQIEDCFPPETRDLRTLVIMTMGGNDISSLTGDAIDGATEEVLWQEIMDAVALQRAAVEWLKDPANFPNGSYVVFANMYEFTDGTGEVMSCDVSGLAGFDQPIPAPDQLAEMVVWANEQYMSIAVDTDSDMIFLLESFCGHGFQADNPEAPCYRGPGAEVWFDLTCIHPNPTGHDQIVEMFDAVISE
ncbi:MAG: hypothetical protein U0168_07785 [Nannocystaceae bacterium]